MHTKLGSLFCVSWLSLACGCDDQVEPGYFGESLLTVTGRVEIANSRTRGELTPAVGFQKGPAITIVDVPVRGSFPSDFRIELYEPPPDSTLYHPTRQEEGEPLAALGYITAVTSDHPEKLYLGNSISTTSHECQDEGRPDDLCLMLTVETCPEPNIDNIPCYLEKHYCPVGDRDSTLCIVESSGDPVLKTYDISSRFAGLSQNYQVIYLAEEAAPGSATAAWLEADDGVPAGFGLYEVHPLTSEEFACRDEYGPAYELATRYYNELHNTNLKNLKCRGFGEQPMHCTMPSEDLEGRTGAQGELHRLLEKAYMELGCPIGDEHYTRVDDPANTAITIVIDSQPPTQLEPPTQP